MPTPRVRVACLRHTADLRIALISHYPSGLDDVYFDVFPRSQQSQQMGNQTPSGQWTASETLVRKLDGNVTGIEYSREEEKNKTLVKDENFKMHHWQRSAG